MWQDGKRLFVRGVISRCSAFDAHGFSHPLNLSITPPLCPPLSGLCTPHKANFWLCSTGNPIFKRQCGTVFIGFQNLAGDKVNYPVVSSPRWESECKTQLVWLRERKAYHDCRLMAGMWMPPGHLKYLSPYITRQTRRLLLIISNIFIPNPIRILKITHSSYDHVRNFYRMCFPTFFVSSTPTVLWRPLHWHQCVHLN